MPVIQRFDPLSAASEAIGSYTTTKRNNELEAAAQRMQQQQSDAATARDAAMAKAAQERQQLDQDKFAYGIKRDATQDAAAAAAAELAAKKEAASELHQAHQDAIAQAKENASEHRDDRRFQIDIAKINQQAKIETQKLANARTIAGIHAAATEGAARIHAAATIESAGIHASATLQAASMHEAGADRRASMRGSRADEESATYGDAINALSPNATKFYESLYSANNQPTRMQAMLALKALARGRSGLSKSDIQNLQTLILSKESQFVSPSNQGSSARANRNYEYRVKNGEQRTSERDFVDTVKGKAFNALPSEGRRIVHHLVVDLQMTPAAAAAEVQSSGLDQSLKSAIVQMLAHGG